MFPLARFPSSAQVLAMLVRSVTLLLGIGMMLSLAGAQSQDTPVADDQRFESGEANEVINDAAAGNPEKSEQPILDTLWKWPVIYRNYDSPLLQELSFFGRYHGQYYLLSSRQGSAEEWENRRIRLGLRAVFLQDWTVGINYNFNKDSGGGLSGSLDQDNVDTLTIAWSPEGRKFQAILGQHKPEFTYEYQTSSNRLLTFERSLLVNQIAPDKSPGLSAEGRLQALQYGAGVFSTRDLGDGLGQPLGLLKLGYDYSAISHFEKASIKLYYLYRTEEDDENGNYYRHSLAGSVDFQQGPYAFVGQLMYANAFSSSAASDVWGATFMPSLYLIEKKLQVVGRYQYASSAGNDGLEVQKRYEREAPGLTDEGLGDRYHALYLGLNYYIYGSKLKVMSGVEYSRMRGGSNGGDYDGWTWFNGIRLYF